MLRPLLVRPALVVVLFAAAIASACTSESPAAPDPVVHSDTISAPTTAPAQTYAVNGVVRDAQGHPIAGATVSISDSSTAAASQTATTDGNGAYAFTGLTANTFTLSVSATGFHESTHAVQATEASTPLTVDFSLTPMAVPTYTVTGNVTNTTATGVGEVAIAVVDNPPHANAGRGTIADGNGHYTLANLASNSFALSASKTGYQTSTRTVQFAAGTDTTTVNFTLTPTVSSYTLRGMVKSSAGAALANASIAITDGPNSGKTATSDGSGNYSIAGLAFSTFTVGVSLTGYQASTRSVELIFGTEIASADFSLTPTTTTPPTTPPPTTPPPTTPPSTVYTLRGTVRNSGGTPLSGATVWVVDAAPNPNAGKTAVTDGSGNYTMTGMSVGSFSVSAALTGYQTATAPTQITTGTVTTIVDFGLAAIPATTHTIHGTVTGWLAAPLSNVVIAVTEPAPSPNAGKNTTSNGAGEYTLNGLSGGAVTLTATVAWYQVRTESVVIPATGPDPTINFQLGAIMAHAVQGTVTRQNAGPASGATVTIAADNRTTTADGSGHYAFTGLSGQGYTISAGLAGYTTAVHNVIPSPGVEYTIRDFVLASAPAITFSGLGASGTAYSGHSEAGFTVTTTQASWTTAGPGVVFGVANTTVQGALRVTGNGQPFRFAAVDIYSSITTIPYSVTGKLAGAVVFQFGATHGNTFGSYVTIGNPSASALIDTLEITMTNTSPSGGANTMGLDNILVSY